MCALFSNGLSSAGAPGAAGLAPGVWQRPALGKPGPAGTSAGSTGDQTEYIARGHRHGNKGARDLYCDSGTISRPRTARDDGGCTEERLRDADGRLSGADFGDGSGGSGHGRAEWDVEEAVCSGQCSGGTRDQSASPCSRRSCEAEGEALRGGDRSEALSGAAGGTRGATEALSGDAAVFSERASCSWFRSVRRRL